MMRLLCFILSGLILLRGNYIDEHGKELQSWVATEEPMESEAEISRDRVSDSGVGTIINGDGSAGDSESISGSDSGDGESDNADDPESGREYFGVCTISHYCNCSKCCGQWAGGNTASGVQPTANRTVAHNYLPFGTRVLINGIEYVVEDRGDANMAGGMWFDVYCGSHEEALQKGLYNTEVYVIY